MKWEEDETTLIEKIVESTPCDFNEFKDYLYARYDDVDADTTTNVFERKNIITNDFYVKWADSIRDMISELSPLRYNIGDLEEFLANHDGYNNEEENNEEEELVIDSVENLIFNDLGFFAQL